MYVQISQVNTVQSLCIRLFNPSIEIIPPAAAGLLAQIMRG